MKRNFTVLAYVVATMAMLASCAREKEGAVDYPAVPEGEGIHVLVVGDGQVDYNETKTAAVEVDPSTTYVKWLSTDKIDVWETSINGETASSKRFTSGAASNLTEEGGYADIKADFGVTFTGTAEGSEYFYTAVYPAGAVEKGSSDFYFFTIPSTQTLSADGNFAENADVMVGTPIHRTERVSEGDKLAYSFSRPGTVVKLRLKGIHSGEVINSITIDAPVNITGRSKINLTTGEISDVAYYADGSLPKTRLQINGNDFTSDGDDDVWVRILSGTWTAGSSLSITVDTDKAVYTKSYENNLPKDFVFAEGGLTKFGFSFGDNNREEKSTATTYTLVTSTSQIVEGAKYLFVARYTNGQTSYYSSFSALHYEKGANKGYYDSEKLQDCGASDDLLTSISVPSTSNATPIIIESAGEANYYTFLNTATNKYISITANTTSGMAESETISDNTKHTLTITDNTYTRNSKNKSITGRGLYSNLSSTRFSSYAGSQGSGKDYLYVDESTLKAKIKAPTFTATPASLGTAIEIECLPVENDTEGSALAGADLKYTVTITGETEVAPFELTETNPEGNFVATVSNLAYGTYVVNITVSDNNDKYRSNYAEDDNVALVQPELQALTISAVADAPARKITVSWTDVKDKDTESVAATSYQLYDGETPVGSAVGAGVQEAVINGESLEWGHEYHLSVVASLAGYVSSVSNTVNQTVAQPQLTAPVIDTEANADAKTILVAWGDVANATHYEVYNGAELVETVAAGVEVYTFTEITYDVDYTITVKAVNKVNTNYLPATSEAAVVNVHNPATIGDFEVLTDVDTPNRVYVTWGEAENATSYDVTLYAGEEEVASETGLTVIEHTFSGVDAGNAYTVSVTAKADGMDDLVKYADGTLTVRNATISYATVTGGTITSDPAGNAKVGTTVTLGNTPATGYELTANSYTVNDEALAGNSFTITGDVTVSGTFHKIDYAITKSGEYASNITVKKAGSVVATAQIDDVITIEAGSVSGKKFVSWTVTGATPTSETANPTTFTMGAGAVTVEANYEDKTTVTYTKVTSASGIVSGGVYLVVCESLNTAMGSQNTNRRNAASVTISNNTIELEPTEVNVDGKPYEITLTKDGSIYYMKASNGYYVGNNSRSNYLKEASSAGDGHKWSISYDSNNSRVVLKTNHSEQRVLCVNTDNNDPYATYTSDDKYGKVTLYKKAGDTPTPPPTPTSYTITLTQPTGGSIDAKVGGATASSAVAGATVTLAVTSTPSGKTFSSWTVTKSKGGTVTVSNNQFEMPDDNVTVEASFTTSGGGEPTLKHTFTPSSTSGSSTPYSYSTAANGGTNPAYTSSQLRLYANNTITVSTSGSANIKKIEIDFCKQGSKPYVTSVSASVGSYTSGGTSSSGDDVKTDTWTGDAKSITFTLGSSGQRVVKAIRIYE